MQNKFIIKTVKPKITIGTTKATKLNVAVNKPIIDAKRSRSYFKLKNTGGPRGEKGDKGDTGTAATITAGTATSLPAGSSPTVTNSGTSSAAVFNFGIPKGDKGDKGDTGSAGAAATISVGSTTTGNPGTNASVTNVGTSSAAVLNFTVPRGAKGDTGATGTAATISIGSTSTGNAGTNASVTNVGTQSAAILNFTIPRGDKGDTGGTGPAGADGKAATIAVGTVTTGAPGTNATVVNSGTSSAAVFDFTIPRGDKGESGSGAGDMLAADYDANNTVKDAGGIVAYVGSQINDGALDIKHYSTTTATGTFVQIANDTGHEAPVTSFELEGNATQDGTPAPTTPVDIDTVTGAQTVRVTGKNLANLDNGNFAIGSTTVTNATVTHDANSTSMEATGTAGAQSVYWASDLCDASATYVFSGKAVKNVSGSAGTPLLRVTYLYSDDGTNWTTGANGLDELTPTQGQVYSFEFTVTGHKYYRLRFFNNSGTPVTIGEKSTYYDIQLELGNQATAFEAYNGQDYPLSLGSLELAKITTPAQDTYQDYIQYANGAWKVNKSIKKVVLDGTEEGFSYLNGVYFCDAGYADTIAAAVLCNRFVSAGSVLSTTQAYNKGNGKISTHVAQGRFYMRNDSLADLAAWQTWLASNNTTIYYIGEATDITITDPTLIAQLNAIRNVTLQQGQNNIVLVPSAGASGTMEIGYSGQSITTFTANSATNASVDIEVPVRTSQLVNNGASGTAPYLETDETAYRTTAIPYGQCDNTSTSTVFTATVPGITELRDGVCMWLKNGVVTSASGFTININGLGAKPVYSNMSAATRETTLFNINYTMFFVYDSTRVDGGCWMLDRGYNSNDNTIGYNIRTNSQSLPASNNVYRYRILFTSADGTKYVPANSTNATSAATAKTVNQTPINPFGPILYYSSTTIVNANANPSTSSLWEQYALGFGHSFNRTGSALTMTPFKPVYIKCAPQSDGSAIMDKDIPFVQDLPTTEDGKIYIFMGIAYSALNMELMLNHPVYEYRGGIIRPYVNAAVTSVNGSTGAITGLQTTSNLVTSVSSASTDTQYPSAKLLYDTVGNVENILAYLNNGGGVQ